MRQKLILALAVTLLVFAVLLVCFPFLSNIYQEHTKAEIFTNYSQAVEHTAREDIHIAMEKAEEYNEALTPGNAQFLPEKLAELSASYEDLLLIGDSEVMGYVEISKLDVTLPIYHGTESKTLEHGCGHLLGSSLPIGGKGTHSILTAHSGLASQKMFSDIDLLEIDDVIKIKVLDRTLVYKVIEKKVVLPEETENIEILPDLDILSLVTCTPFGINTHRLVVTAVRTSDAQMYNQEAKNTSLISQESIWEQEYLKGLSYGLLSFAGICTCIILPQRHFKKRSC